MDPNLNKLVKGLKFFIEKNEKFTQTAVATIRQLEVDIDESHSKMNQILLDIKTLEAREANILKTSEELDAFLKLIDTIDNDRLQILDGSLSSLDEHFAKLNHIKRINKYDWIKNMNHLTAQSLKKSFDKYNNLMFHGQKRVANLFRNLIKYYSDSTDSKKIQIFIDHLCLKNNTTKLFIPNETLAILTKMSTW